MNAEKIEVGDVWKNKYDGSLCHIISVKKDEVTYFCKKDMEIWISSIPLCRRLRNSVTNKMKN